MPPLIQSLLDSKLAIGIASFALAQKQRFFVLLICVFSLYLFLSLLSYHAYDPAWSHLSVHSHKSAGEFANIGGMGGAWIADVLYLFFGYGAWAVFLWLSAEAVYAAAGTAKISLPWRILAYAFLWLCLCVLIYAVALKMDVAVLMWGGVLGHELYLALAGLLHPVGAVIFSLFGLFGIGYLMIDKVEDALPVKRTPLYKSSDDVADAGSLSVLTAVLKKQSITADATVTDPAYQPHGHKGALESFLRHTNIKGELSDDVAQLTEKPESAPSSPAAFSAASVSVPLSSATPRAVPDRLGNAIEKEPSAPKKSGWLLKDGQKHGEKQPTPTYELTDKAVSTVAVYEHDDLYEDEYAYENAYNPKHDHQRDDEYQAYAHQADTNNETTSSVMDRDFGQAASFDNTDRWGGKLDGYTPSPKESVRPTHMAATHIVKEAFSGVDLKGLNADRPRTTLNEETLQAVKKSSPPVHESSASYERLGRDERTYDNDRANSSFASSPSPSPSHRTLKEAFGDIHLAHDRADLSESVASDFLPNVGGLHKKPAEPTFSTQAGSEFLEVDGADLASFKKDEPTPTVVARPDIHDDKAYQTKSFAMQTAAYRSSLPALPSLDLLDPKPMEQVGYSPERLTELAELLQIKLSEFNVNAQVMNVVQGPIVTSFEVQLAAGVKASKVTNISKDLARSLSMPSLRVVEVIAGKPYIGIEIPNEKKETVKLIELLQSPDYQDGSNQIAMAMGKDIGGNVVITDLAKAPHMLVAGTTGSGKSVLVNAMLMSMLLKYTPDELRLVLIDPKMLELANYGDIPHLLTPVVTDMAEAASVLSWCVGEMERRYQLMTLFKVRKLDEFNKKIKAAEAAGQPLLDPLWRPNDSVSISTAPKLKPLPLIVVVADEFADMMMQVGKQAEELITRLAQKSRAAGIHLMLATQRPSVDVITGLIKANIPSRAALRVNSKVDSRTILDAGGAEDMLGHGDMLFLAPGKNEPIRVHGAYVTDAEVNRITDAWRERGAPDYIEVATSVGDYTDSPKNSDNQDPLYDEALAFVMDSGKTSISAVQRRLSIGYNRAANIVEAMEANGVLSAPDNSGKRTLL
ncbi:MAG: DNA translocase FtsK 4TM domain-containing protein [Moraxella sp.]|nr:DNA translocase FtsK 4TM domain-containing protein [Moraxella sp.]